MTSVRTINILSQFSFQTKSNLELTRTGGKTNSKNLDDYFFKEVDFSISLLAKRKT